MASGRHFVGEPVYTPVVQAQNKLISDSMSISAAVAFIPPAIRIISPPFVIRLTSSSSPDKELDMLGDGTDDDAPADVEGEGDNTMLGDGTDDDTPADVEGEGDNTKLPGALLMTSPVYTGRPDG